ncbi:MAG: 16S rRNA (guanine(966)-N(2))-methyltransferase RsmD [Bacillota bacterium]|nr:16S rRNA (guanine(966)-N(2))-methyltransferase RsmD [Bacillota bacterium]
MRVITGLARGKRLKTLEGDDVRPTTDRVKEAVFSMIQFQTEGRRFLDLFAGSGQMGIEALSRGAAESVFVDSNYKSIEIIKKNLNFTGLIKNAKVLQINSLDFLRQNNGKFDIAFLDPPYNTGILQKVLPDVANHMQISGIILCETSRNDNLPLEINEFMLDREYHYGKIKIVTYCHRSFLDNE